MDLEPEPVVWYVGGAGYETVNDVMKVVRPGDIIRVRPGIYTDEIVIDKPVMFYGSGVQTVYTTTVIISANDVTVSGHTFMNIYDNSTIHDWDYGGLVTRQPNGPISDSYISRLTVSSCTFRNNRQGVFLFGAKDSTVTNCDFYNSFRGVSIGPHKIGTSIVWSSSGNTVSNNNFYGMVGDGLYDGDAVAIWESNSNTVSGNTMDGNSYGVTITGGVGNTVTGNTITNSTYHALALMSMTGANSLTVTQNLIQDNEDSIWLDSASGVSITGNTFSSNDGLMDLKDSNTISVTGNTISEDTVFINSSTRVNFAGNTLSDSSLILNTSSSNSFSGNTMTNSSVYLKSSPTNSFTSNIFSSGGSRTFNFEGDEADYNVDIQASNTVGGKPIHYYYNDNNINLMDGDIGSLLIAYSDDAVVTNTKVTDGDGVWVYNSPRASLEVDVTNGLMGINVENSPGVDIKDSSVNASMRGLYGVRMADMSSGKMTDSSVEAEGPAPAFLIEDESDLNTYNVTFDGNDVDATGGLLSVYNYLAIKVWDDGRLTPLENVDVEVTEDDMVVYSTAHFGGSDPLTDASGMVSDILLLDREYDHSTSATEHDHNVSVWVQIDAVYADSANMIDMSGPLTVVFEASDIRAPSTPMNLVVLDLPAQDAIEISWDANSDDTEIYSLYSNMTGDWDLVVNQSEVTYTITTGLVHGVRYWFAVSSWDEVPLESPWSSIAGVVHADALAPAAPTGLVLVEVTGTTISMGWAANTEADVEGYNLYMNESGGDDTGPWVLLAGGLTALEFEATDLTSETMYHFVVTAFDEVPNESPLSLVLSVMTLDITPPDAPILDELAEFTNVETLAVTGTAEPGSTVTVFIGATEVATGVAEGDGTFSIEVTLTEGPNVITAWATDASDNTGPLSLEGSIILDTVAPDAPELEDLPELTNVVEHTITGTVEPLTTVTVLLNEEEVLLLATDDSGEFEVTIELEEGENTIVAFATDRATNIGESVGLTVRLDTTAPVVNAGEDAEYIEGDESTLDGSESSDDVGILSYEWTFTWDGSTESLDGEVAKYTFDHPEVVTITLTVTDLAGNTATDEVVLTILLRNGPPTLTDGDITPDQGTTGTEFTFEVTFTDPDGDDGEVWIFIDGQPYVMTPDPDDTDSSDGRKYTYTTKLEKGEHSYYFTGKDALDQEAGGPSAGEDNASSSPDVSKKKTEDTPGMSATIMLLAMIVVVAVAVAIRKLR
ncbi:MAG: right-handed parallel beta-helix repeat-containing protein [Thermoplasmata archaeon]|nr:MAG: right-handed parallel beta-helix repeat-containing protein [Thermoplasmata archaeon]